MDAIRSSLILSVGERAGGIASRVQDFTEERWPEIEPVVAYVNLASDGTVTRRRHGELQELETLTGLTDEEKPGVYRSNFQLLCGELADPIERLIKDLLRDVRLRETLAELRAQRGWADSERVYLHVLTDCFGPVASTFPLALLRILDDHDGIDWAGRLPVSVNLVYFLPGLFQADVEDLRLARSHATFSELESYLSPIDPHARRTPPSCKVWVVGSIDRRGGAVHDFSPLVTPIAQFTSRLIDGSLEGDTSWENELGRKVDERQTFLSSFGFADLYFPRTFLRELALHLGRSQLCHHLVGERPEVDADAVSADVQTWITEVKLDQLVGRLQSPREGNMVFKVPVQPDVSPEDLDAAKYEQQLETRLVEDLQLGGNVQRAGNDLFEGHRERLLERIAKILDDRSGLPEAREFCEHLQGHGRGLTEALVGQRVRNLEGLMLDLQTYFHREAGLKGDPAREKELKTVLIPGKAVAVRDAQERIVEAEKHLRELYPSEEGDPEVTEAEPASDESPSEAGGAVQSEQAAEDRPAAEDTEVAGDGQGPESAPESESDPESQSDPGSDPGSDDVDVLIDEGRADLEARIATEREDLAQYRKELEKLKQEHEVEKKHVRESRQLARDPARRHQLLHQLRAAELEERAEHGEKLRTATRDRFQSRETWKHEAGRLRGTLLTRLLLIPLGLGLLAYAGYLLAANQLDSVTYSAATARNLTLGALALGFLLGLFPAFQRWNSYRAAWLAYQEALRQVGHFADALWRHRVAGLRKRFDFLIHAEAIRILDRLQDEALSESSRMKKLGERLERYGEEAERAMVEAKMETSLYHRPVLLPEQVDELVRDNKVLKRTMEEVVDGVTLSQLVTSARDEELGDRLPPSIAETESELDRRSVEELSKEHIGTVVDRTLTGKSGADGNVRNWWLSVQEAALSWISIKAAGPQGTLRSLYFIPSGASDGLKSFLQEASVGDSSADLRETEDRDQLGACETWIGFATHQVAELSMSKESLDRSWDAVSAVEGALPLSLPSTEVVISVDREDAYALLQAALAYLKAAGGFGDEAAMPEELLKKYRAADEYPAETLAQLRDRVELSLETREGAAQRFQRFLQGLDRRDRRMIEHLIQVSGRS